MQILNVWGKRAANNIFCVITHHRHQWSVCMKEAPNWVRNDVSYYLNYFHFFFQKNIKRVRRKGVYICAQEGVIVLYKLLFFSFINGDVWKKKKISYIYCKYVNKLTTPYQSQTHIRNEMKVRPSRVETNNYN